MTGVYGPRPSLSRYFESAAQTIVPSGALTLAHGLGVEPVFVHLVLVCVTAQHGYAIADRVFWGFGDDGLVRGVAVVPDAVNLNIRCQPSSVFAGKNKTTGAIVVFGDANWNMIFRAWA